MTIAETKLDYKTRVAINLNANFINCTLAQLTQMAVITDSVLTELKIEAKDQAIGGVGFMDTDAGKEYMQVNNYFAMIERRRFYLIDEQKLTHS